MAVVVAGAAATLAVAVAAAVVVVAVVVAVKGHLVCLWQVQLELQGPETLLFSEFSFSFSSEICVWSRAVYFYSFFKKTITKYDLTSPDQGLKHSLNVPL